MNITVWQCRPNYHDIEIYKGLARYGYNVKFVFDTLDNFRGTVDPKLALNQFEFFIFKTTKFISLSSLARYSDVNIIVGGTAFKSTFFAHLISKKIKKIFISEGRYASLTVHHKVRDLIEFFICKSEKYLYIGENANLYFRNIFGEKINKSPFFYCYQAQKYIENYDKNKKIDFNESYFQVGYVGRGMYSKGVDIFFEIAENLPRLKFTFVGKLDDKFTKRAASIKNLTLIGWVSPNKVFDLMGMINVLIVPSRLEAYGCVVQEGVTAGCRVLCSKYVGARNLASLYPNSVKIIEEDSPLSYAKEIVSIFECYSIGQERVKPYHCDFNIDIGVNILQGHIVSIVGDQKL